eukprot:m.36105 g.36105  ORF g.36105 m.36105 type:complete len:426 (+) comp5374_c0_seq2:169-1446(+)
MLTRALNGGPKQALVGLRGNIVAKSAAGGDLPVPITLWLPAQYPARQIVCRVRPAAGWRLTPTRDVGVDGIVRLRENPSEGSSLINLIMDLAGMFSSHPPIAKQSQPPYSAPKFAGHDPFEPPPTTAYRPYYSPSQNNPFPPSPPYPFMPSSATPPSSTSPPAQQSPPAAAASQSAAGATPSPSLPSTAMHPSPAPRAPPHAAASPSAPRASPHGPLPTAPLPAVSSQPLAAASPPPARAAQLLPGRPAPPVPPVPAAHALPPHLRPIEKQLSLDRDLLAYRTAVEDEILKLLRPEMAEATAVRQAQLREHVQHTRALQANTDRLRQVAVAAREAEGRLQAEIDRLARAHTQIPAVSTPYVNAADSILLTCQRTTLAADDHALSDALQRIQAAHSEGSMSLKAALEVYRTVAMRQFHIRHQLRRP